MVSSDDSIIVSLKNSIVTKINTLIGNHNRSNTAHSDIRNSIPTTTSQLTNDSGYLTSHQDITGKLDKAQGTSNASKNVVTDANGNITVEAKPTIPSANVTATNIKMNGTQSAGSLTSFAKADHVHPTDTSRVAVSQGTTNSGKFLKVNSSGNVACESVTASDILALSNIELVELEVTYTDDTPETIKVLKYTGT